MRRTNRIGVRIWAALGLLLLLVAGMGAMPHAQDGIVPNPKVVGAPLIETPGTQGGTLVTASTGETFYFNPIFAFNTSARQMTARLLDENPLNFEIELELAESYELSADGTEITITLREGLLWSDGEPFTAADVLYTYNDVVANPELEEFLDGEGLTLPPFTLTQTGERTLLFEFEDDYGSDFVDLIARQAIIPRHSLGDVTPGLNPDATVETFTEAWRIDTPPSEIVTLGPFVLSEVEVGSNEDGEPIASRIVMTRNPNYWKVDTAGTQLPYADQFIENHYVDEDGILNGITSGEVNIEDVDKDQAIELSSNNNVELTVGDPAISAEILTFDQDVEDPELQALFRDERFRQAMAHSLDRAALIAEIPENLPFVEPRESVVFPKSPFYSNLATVHFPYDLNQAAALLDDIGILDTDGDGIREFASGNPVEFELVTNSENDLRVAAAEALQQIWGQLGISIVLAIEPFDEFRLRFDLGNRQVDLEAGIFSFGLGDPILRNAEYLECQFGSQGSCHVQRFSDADAPTERQQRIDDIFDSLGEFGLSESERDGLLTDLQILISQDLGQIPLWSGNFITAHGTSVQNAQSIGVYGLAPSLQYVWIN